MNEKEVTRFLIMKILDKAEDGIMTLNHPTQIDHKFLRRCLNDIRYYVSMIIEDNKCQMKK